MAVRFLTSQHLFTSVPTYSGAIGLAAPVAIARPLHLPDHLHIHPGRA